MDNVHEYTNVLPLSIPGSVDNTMTSTLKVLHLILASNLILFQYAILSGHISSWKLCELVIEHNPMIETIDLN